jgi:hypothetical protein
VNRGPARRALAAAAIYVVAMVTSAGAARRIVENSWIARTGQAPRALMVGPAPVTPLRKSIIVDVGDHYVEGTFAWFPTRVSFGDVTPKNDDARGLAAARADREIAGILVWSRFPFWEIRPTAEGTELRVRDMRFKGFARGGFTAAVVLR